MKKCNLAQAASSCKTSASEKTKLCPSL